MNPRRSDCSELKNIIKRETHRTDCSELIAELRKHYTIDEIRNAVGVCPNTVYKWSVKGKNNRPVPKLAEQVLRRMMK